MNDPNTAPPVLEAPIPPPPPIEGPLPPPPPIVPVAPVEFRVPRPRPLLGPSLWIFGALLWAQIVVGYFVVVKDLPEAAGVLALFVATAAAWWLSVQQRQRPASFAFRHLAPALLALLYWAGAILFGMLAAAMSGGGAGVTVLLWLIAATALIIGWRMSGPPLGQRTLARRALSFLIWAVVVFFTVPALVQILDDV